MGQRYRGCVVLLLLLLTGDASHSLASLSWLLFRGFSFVASLSWIDVAKYGMMSFVADRLLIILFGVGLRCGLQFIGT